MLKSEQADFRDGDKPASQTGRVLGHYRIIRKLGEGAAASVYEAEDSRIGRNVALKVLNRPEGQDTERNEREIARFKREARTIARLPHANIVTIYDIGEQDNDYYIVMECLPGMTLRERLDKGPIEPEEAAVIIGQIASALNAIHSHDIVHRDIKPSNVMLLPNDDPSRRDWVKLLDFGIARLGDDSSITHAGTLIGSPSYMSPEQVRGESATKLSDIWALGVLIYELLSGTPPFKGPMITTVLYQIDHANPEPLTGRLAAVNPVIETALAKNPQQRYTSAGAVSAALSDALALSPTSSDAQKARQGSGSAAAREASTVETRTVEFARKPGADSDKAAPTADSRRPIIVAACAIGFSLIALVGAFGVSSFLAGRQHDARTAPTESTTPAPGQPATPARHASAIAQPTPAPIATPQSSPMPAPAATSTPASTATPIAATPAPKPTTIPAATPHPTPRPAATPARPKPKATPKPVASAIPHPTPAPTPKVQPTPAPIAAPANTEPTPGPIEKRPEPRRHIVTPPEGSPVSEKVTSARDLLGSWTGRIHNRPARISIRQSDGNGFSGEATITTGSGSAHFAIAGDLQPDGDKLRIAFQSVRLLPDSTLKDVDFGQQSGHMIDGGNMAGMGKDMQFLYTWNLSR